MRIYRATTVATAAALLLSFTGAALATEMGTHDHDNAALSVYGSLSNSAQGSDVMPTTAVQKKAHQEEVSEYAALYRRDPRVIGTPSAAGSPGVTSLRGTEAGPPADPPNG